MSNGKGSPSVSYKNAFYEWLKSQYGSMQAWAIRQMVGEPPWYEGQNKYYDYWLKAGKPIKATPSAPEVERGWQPADDDTMYDKPEVPAEMKPQLEKDYPWLSSGQTEEQYHTDRPWLKVGMTEAEYLRHMMGLTEEEVDLRPEIAEWQGMNRQVGLERQGRLSAEAMGRLWSREATEAREGGTSNAEKAKIYESARSAMLANIGNTPRDWIKYWSIANKPNPYSEEDDEISPADRAGKWDLEVKKARDRFKTVDELHKQASSDPGRQLSWGEQQEWEDAKTRLVNALQQKVKADRALDKPDFINRYSDYGEGWGEGASKWAAPRGDAVTGYEIGKPDKKSWLQPDTPAAPDWLAKHWPEATQMLDPTKYRVGGEPLRVKKANIGVPSGQGWSRMPWSQREAYLGYMSWTGKEPMDVLDTMAMQLPQPRSGSRWTPYGER